MQLADEGSGIRDNDPLDAEVNLRDADDDDEIEDLVINISLPLATTAGLPDGIGYYSFTGSVTDKAGNVSEEAARTALHDPAGIMASTIVGNYNEKTGEYSMVATVTDDLSIKEYWSESRFGDITVGAGGTITGGLFLPREGAVSVDAYNAASLTQATLAASFTAHSYKFLQTGATAATALTSIGVVASHHGSGSNSSAPDALSPALTAPTDVAGGLFDLEATAIAAPDQAASVDQPFPDAAYKVFQTLTAAAEESDGTVELTATATGTLFVKPTVTTAFDDGGTPNDPSDDTQQVLSDATEGLRDNPLTRVDFYATVATAGGNGRDALKYIGSVSGSAAGAEDFDSDPAADPAANDSRRYIYTLELSKADFLAIVGGKGDYGVAEDGTADTTVDAENEGAIYAFGVQDNKGVALQSTAPVDLYVKR